MRFEGSISTFTPKTISTPTPGIKATTTPMPSDTTAPTPSDATVPTPSDTAPAGASTGEAPKQSIQEFLKLYEEISDGPITDVAEKVKIIRLY